MTSPKRRILIVAGAGSGKTEVMARRVVWWTAVDGVPKDGVVAFTFTERAAEEMKFRIRRIMESVAPAGGEPNLGGMYVGTIHGFCLKLLRELLPDRYHNYEVLDEAARLALVQKGYFGVLGLDRFRRHSERGYFNAIGGFLRAYDLLNEYDALEVRLPPGPIPHALEEERDWCRRAKLRESPGRKKAAKAFGECAARYYAYLHCRRFLDFSTSQSEVMRVLREDDTASTALRNRVTHLVVDEVQDLNRVQEAIVRALMGETSALTAVGDHRQAIYGWRGSSVEIMGRLHEKIGGSQEGRCFELRENFRSTPRIVAVGNEWAGSIGAVRKMRSEGMIPGEQRRLDREPSHVAAVHFKTRAAEARWIARTIKRLVPGRSRGAWHDTSDGERGITYSDTAILLRSATSVREYMEALTGEGIPAVFRAGPDLFSRPEVLLFTACLAQAAGIRAFREGGWNPKSLGNRIQEILGCRPLTPIVISRACEVLRGEGLRLERDAPNRLVLAADSLAAKFTSGEAPRMKSLKKLRCADLRDYLTATGRPRRVFPQRLYQLFLAEGEVGKWEGAEGRGEAAMYHLGQLSSLITGLETPGWTRTEELGSQILGLCLWGAENARMEEAPLLAPPDAVTVGTIHAAKGLEYAAVFVADVCPRRFPSQFARRVDRPPFDGGLLKRVNPAGLADNENNDGERRLMYVAVTRAERYLFVTGSAKREPSAFFTGVAEAIRKSGGCVSADPTRLRLRLRTAESSFRRDVRLITSFSDLRYYIECPHDFYLRKVLGFSPTIDQAFGYGRGVHNVLRAIHSEPKRWAALAAEEPKLRAELENLVRSGMFYLRQTTGEPAENMRNKAVRILSHYVRLHAGELARLEFDAEREFETLIREEQVLIHGAIDVVRLDEPPRVTIIDFKSGDRSSDSHMKLDEEQMRLQVSLYGMAAKSELEYEPDKGLVRYLGETDPGRGESQIDLAGEATRAARRRVVEVARNIRNRRFHSGPTTGGTAAEGGPRCARCDFLSFCGLDQAAKQRLAETSADEAGNRGRKGR